nr:MAG TPA: hypothetical protein [Caudoviricetes sp.]
MQISTTYREGLKRILETNDMSRFTRDIIERLGGLRLVLFWIPPTGRERADSIIDGSIPLQRGAVLAWEQKKAS